VKQWLDRHQAFVPLDEPLKWTDWTRVRVKVRDRRGAVLQLTLRMDHPLGRWVLREARCIAVHDQDGTVLERRSIEGLLDER
jgi:hypothetical protein